MTNEAKRLYLKEIQQRYHRVGKKQKSLILNEFCAVCGYSRKHGIKLLNDPLSAYERRPGAPVKYSDEVDEHLKILWEAMGKICSKKMVAAFPIWLPFYSCPFEIKFLLQQISPATIDRHLEKHRTKARKGLGSTSPSLLKNKIPIELLDHDVKEPGFIEADTVAHCGNSLAGEFINSLTMTDIKTGWTENRAVWRKESHTVLGAIRSIERSLPFKIKGFASDNGNEFFNHDLHNHFKDRKSPVHFVRRRPYQKNDNAHVEQKNWTHVRELFGYDRFEKPIQVRLMNEIYKKYWNPLWNYFTPVMKLKTKTRIGGRVVKVYDDPKTPCQRLLESGCLTDEEKKKLEDRLKHLNPFRLRLELEKKLKWIFRLVEVGRRELSDAG
jgi:hypothetical protein